MPRPLLKRRRLSSLVANEEQQKIARAYVNQLQAAKVYRKPIVTQITPLKAFYQARTITWTTSRATRTSPTS